MRNPSRSSGKGEKVVLSLLLLLISIDFLLTWIAGSNLEDYSNHDGTTAGSSKPYHPKGRRPQTMAPQESGLHTAGFIHVGKTGGSTISNLLRNGCTSFVAGPCRSIEHESIVSQKVEHYYHVPDFHRLPTANHESFIISVRDVFQRTISSFLYHHPKNAAANNVTLTKGHAEYGPLAYSCFDTLDDFATMVGGISNPEHCKYPYRHNVVDATDCAALACATLHGKVRFFVHLFFNFRNILYTKLPKDNDPQNEIQKQRHQKHRRHYYSIRQEYLWQDWKALNIRWGQIGEVYIPPSNLNQRNISAIALPVGRGMTPASQQLLCRALTAEYMAYFRILRMSENIMDDDFEQSVRIAEKSCPTLDFRTMVRPLMQ